MDRIEAERYRRLPRENLAEPAGMAQSPMALANNIAEADSDLGT
jgi:hypothetical protein